MPGSRDTRAGPRPRLVPRFSRTERLLHWTNALCFFFLLASGLALYVPALSMALGRRLVIQRLHFWAGLVWIGALLAIVLLGDRRGLARTARELDAFDRDDLRWLLGRRPARQARFNAGQKINAALTAAMTVLFLVSGLLLWFGERDTELRFASTILLHDGLMFAAVALVIGHIYLAAMHPPTRHSLRGMTRGSVREDWAMTHHPKWRWPERESTEAEQALERPIGVGPQAPQAPLEQPSTPSEVD
jgi:formate dehydrogenase subunit gamma